MKVYERLCLQISKNARIAVLETDLAECTRQLVTESLKTASLEAAMKEIARIAHEGGLDGMGERSALNAIRKLLLPWWDGKEKTT